MKTRRYLAVGLALQLLLSTTYAAELSAAQRREIIFECQQLVTDYAYYRDLRDADKFAELFTDDARLLARGQWIEGQQGLREHVNGDDMDTVSLHLMTTIKIIPHDETSATGISYVAVARGPKAEDAVPLENFVVVGKYNDSFVLTDDGWRIAERSFRPTFRNPPSD